MSRKNAVKIITAISESSGYHFKSCADDSSYVIASKHGLCTFTEDCEPYQCGVKDCCKFCDIDLDISNLSLTKKDGKSLTPKKVYGFPNKDIAIVQVMEKSFTPLKLGKIKENIGGFLAFGYKSETSDPSRLLLDAPEVDGDVCYFNIESNSTPELIEKSVGYYGMSGSLVIGRGSTDIPVAYSVITTNEESNDLLGDALYDIDYDELNTIFESNIFSKQNISIRVNTEFKDYFEEIDVIKVSENLSISVLVPIEKGFPYFNLSPIATSLTNELELVLGHKDKALNKSVLIASALQVLRNEKEKQPTYKLLSSRVVESMMNAPHIYSTYIDHSHYHHIHLLNEKDSEVDYVVSCFGGEGDLTEKLNQAINQIVDNINHYSFNSRLISDRAFLNMKYSHEECELLYEVLFGEQKGFISNISIINCIDLNICINHKVGSIEDQIRNLVHNAVSNIEVSTLESISRGLKLYLYIIPVNKGNELTELVEGILA